MLKVKTVKCDLLTSEAKTEYDRSADCSMLSGVKTLPSRSLGRIHTLEPEDETKRWRCVSARP